jgi:hypothetical protein
MRYVSNPSENILLALPTVLTAGGETTQIMDFLQQFYGHSCLVTGQFHLSAIMKRMCSVGSLRTNLPNEE